MTSTEIQQNIKDKHEPPSTLPKPFVFVLMPLDPKLKDTYTFGIKGAADDIGAYAERLDEQIFVEGMLDRIFNQINKADVIVADMTGRNPNVFYEVGYAHALGKIVLLVTQDAKDIPFDLKHRQHIIYGGEIETLRSQLAVKLRWAVQESKQRRANRHEQLSVRLAHLVLNEGQGLSDIPTFEAHAFSTPDIPIFVRNESLESSVSISRAYLFAEPGVHLVPRQDTEIQVSSGVFLGIGSTTNYVRSEPYPIVPFDAHPEDATDGLWDQFQLPLSFGVVPPWATERAALKFIFQEPKDADFRYRLRLHTDSRFYDFTFRLRFTFTVDDRRANPEE